ncbi:Dehydrogenase (flavoprotein) [Chitinophaga sp. CF118]|uniref:lysine-epsilon-oxidase maturase LodB n=1 Tax=Chitinophaga sp. CF118 TaxID=1884367 RepID=UPI0008F16B97|nr:lysine-epsilon-oxidase maturase LodB [Chitinophaga sp. CF118]SFE46723.1 Dehydrogenase (flavoprotein) [Chitinophaga sp. CF118]
MASHIQTDVLILGGGPAGAAAALCLLTHTKLRVIIVESGAFEGGRVGEHVEASIFDLLKYLKISREELDKEGIIEGYDSLAAWGSDHITSRHSIYNIEGSSYQLDRDIFDPFLVTQVAARGGQLFPNTKALHFNQAENGDWSVPLRHKTKGNFTIDARFLVDATGRQGQVCRYLGLAREKHDELVGIGAYLHVRHDELLAQRILLETAEQGWWYCATLPGRRLVATLFTDADLTKKHKWQQAVNWTKLLSSTRHLRHLTDGTVAYGKPWVRNAFSQFTETGSRTNFLAVGDAAAAFDPVSSMGIGFAISSACHAAIAIHQFLLGDETGVVLYRGDIAKHYNQYLQLRLSYYKNEQRWQDSPFWQRRLAKN